MNIDYREVDHDTEVINAIKKFALPVVLYGNGKMAELEERTLEKNSVSVACRTVDAIPPPRVPNVVPVSLVDGTFRSYVLVLANGNAISAAVRPGGLEQLKAKFRNAAYMCYLDDVYGFEVISEKFCRSNEKRIRQLYDSLGDEKSKRSMEAYLSSQINRDRRFLIPHVEVPQYFSVAPMKITQNEIFVDCGAYDGDTIRDFMRAVDGKYRHIFAFEPDRENARELRTYVSSEGFGNISIVEVGAYDCKTRLRFGGCGDTSAITEDGNVVIETDTIDDVTQCEATSIKMDIEGGETKALLGAIETIKRCKPNLMVCVYHNPADLIEIPSFIKALVPSYQFYFRVHRAALVDAVLYATVR